jgi:hypothetical protein
MPKLSQIKYIKKRVNFLLTKNRKYAKICIMKNLLFTLFIILFPVTLYGHNGQTFWEIFDDPGIEILPLKYEFDISEGFQLNHEFSVGLINYYFENSKTGLGFDTRLRIPFVGFPLYHIFLFPKYYYNSQNHIINFFGINIYWNIFKLIDSNKDFIKNSIFGPCFSFEYLNWNLSEPFITMFYNYNFKIGIRYSLLWILDDEPEGRVFTPIINFEAGYKNINGKNNIYLSIQTNILWLMGLWWWWDYGNYKYYK